MKEWDSVELSNDYIAVTLLPEIGGKIHGAVDKHNGYEFIYQNTVIKPALVGIAGPWVSGGVEFNWPQHHRPTTFMPAEATIQENPDGSKTCWMGESEPLHRMRGMVGVTVYPDSSLVEAKAVVYNRTAASLPFMWWNNLAVRVHEKYKAMFPPDVEYGADHDRRAVVPFPEMKGIYHTARPYDYGEGTDASWFSNVIMPTSVMVLRGQCDRDYLGGYDFAADAGTITVADHYVSIGKKMWTWGDSAFGHAWSDNLTDNGDRYIELMTGVYTDNQPDFTMIEAGETKEFTQVWYPIHGIGEVSNATRDAALSVGLEDEKLQIGIVTTKVQTAVQVVVRSNGELLHTMKADIAPNQCFVQKIELKNAVADSLTVDVYDQDGKELVNYKPYQKGSKQKPEVRKPAPFPHEIDSIELLYLHGSHLEQYKHFTHNPADYYGEALRRDPDDYRCNLAMGRLLLERADFENARVHFERAIKRITLRHENTADTEAKYQLARLELLCGNAEKAYELFRAAAWQYSWRSASYFECGCIDSAKGDSEKAVDMLTLCLETNTKHFAARVLRGYLTKDTDAIKQVLQETPQDTFARFALFLLADRPVEDFVLNRAEDVLDAALDFKKAGLNQEAARVLRACKKPTQLTYYHLAALEGTPPEHTGLHLCFPNRLEDIEVLSVNEWQAQYLLGCLYYDRDNYHQAMQCWLRSKELHAENAFTHRNIALGLFDHFDKKEEALLHMQKALALAPENARILYELLQMMKSMGFSVKERLALLEKHPEQAKARDDCYLDWIVLYTQDNQLEKAAEMILQKRFHIYEGGEGNLTKHHAWLHLLRALAAEKEGDTQKALALLEQALVFPDNYGEGRHYSAQEGNVDYFAGRLYQKLGNEQKAKEAFEKAIAQPDHITEISVFTALALKALGRDTEAQEYLQRMCEAADEMIENENRLPYYGVGTPAPLPFELDLPHNTHKNALLIRAVAEKALGHEAAAQQAAAELENIDPYNAKMCFMKMVGVV